MAQDIHHCSQPDLPRDNDCNNDMMAIMAETSVDHPPACLLGLPVDLRMQIFDQLLYKGRSMGAICWIWLDGLLRWQDGSSCTYPQGERDPVQSVVPLLQVCKQINTEILRWLNAYRGFWLLFLDGRAANRPVAQTSLKSLRLPAYASNIYADIVPHSTMDESPAWFDHVFRQLKALIGSRSRYRSSTLTLDLEITRKWTQDCRLELSASCPRAMVPYGLYTTVIARGDEDSERLECWDYLAVNPTCTAFLQNDVASAAECQSASTSPRTVTCS